MPTLDTCLDNMYTSVNKNETRMVSYNHVDFTLVEHTKSPHQSGQNICYWGQPRAVRTVFTDRLFECVRNKSWELRSTEMRHAIFTRRPSPNVT